MNSGSKLYLLNTLVIPIDFDAQTSATAKIKKISIEEARKMILDAHSNGTLESAIGHQATAQLFSDLIGIEIPCRRITVFMKKGDMGIHLFLKQRLPEGVILDRSELEKLEFWLILSEIVDAVDENKE